MRLLPVVGLLLVLVGVAPHAQAIQVNALQRPGVELTWVPGVDETYLEPIADIVAIANKTLESTFPSLPKKQVRVHVLPKQTGWQTTITDRRDAIYIQLGPGGLGEYYRGDAGPVGILCQAVAELHNPRRLAGFDRFVTHAYLAPAVVRALGADPIPSNTATSLANDGPAMLVLITSPEYVTIHPDFAAVAALKVIQEKLGLAGLQLLLDTIPDYAMDPFAALQEATLARAPALAPAFEAYDEASRLQAADDGSRLIASFEADEGITRPTSHALPSGRQPLALWPWEPFEVTPSTEWAAHGAQSLKLHAAEPRPRMVVGLSDPDWKLKDWRRFSQFDMDIKLEAEEPQSISVRLRDDIANGHGEVNLFTGVVQPGEVCHVESRVNAIVLQGRKSPQGAYFGEGFRADEVAGLLVEVHNPTRPFSIYLDDVRVMVREPGEPERPTGWISGFEADELPLWTGVQPEFDRVTEGEFAGRWEKPELTGTVSFNVEMDWTPYQFLEFDCYSETVTNDRFMLWLKSMDPERPHGDYWAYMFAVNWTGWRHYKIPFRRLLHIRNPIGWNRVTALCFRAHSWGMAVNPDTVLVFDNMYLTPGKLREVPRGVVDDFEDGPWAWWWMDDGRVPPHGGERCGDFPLHEGWRYACGKPMTPDWTPYRELKFWLYSHKLDGEVLEVRVWREGGGRTGIGSVPLGGDGWREATVPLTPNPGLVREIDFCITGLRGDDDGVPNRLLDPEAFLCFDDIVLK
jgi:hypothetical protein